MLRTGVDIIEIARIERLLARYGDAFLRRVYTQAEIQRYGQRPQSLAARWAAKEAVAKALGTGIGPVSWTEIEVLEDALRAPVLHLNGEAAALAARLGLSEWAISLSHTGDLAIAFVVAKDVTPAVARNQR
ncbi:MAG: holo-[acyl-carrier-protein] synthase [Clostridia bacterium]|nr:MAG: holo-[acyl-carrier-protein] synthase [Clostridia bacterium]